MFSAKVRRGEGGAEHAEGQSSMERWEALFKDAPEMKITGVNLRTSRRRRGRCSWKGRLADLASVEPQEASHRDPVGREEERKEEKENEDSDTVKKRPSMLITMQGRNRWWGRPWLTLRRS